MPWWFHCHKRIQKIWMVNSSPVFLSFVLSILIRYSFHFVLGRWLALICPGKILSQSQGLFQGTQGECHKKGYLLKSLLLVICAVGILTEPMDDDLYIDIYILFALVFLAGLGESVQKTDLLWTGAFCGAQRAQGSLLRCANRFRSSSAKFLRRRLCIAPARFYGGEETLNPTSWRSEDYRYINISWWSTVNCYVMLK